MLRKILNLRNWCQHFLLLHNSITIFWAIVDAFLLVFCFTWWLIENGINQLYCYIRHMIILLSIFIWINNNKLITINVFGDYFLSWRKNLTHILNLMDYQLLKGHTPFVDHITGCSIGSVAFIWHGHFYNPYRFKWFTLFLDCFLRCMIYTIFISPGRWLSYCRSW